MNRLASQLLPAELLEALAEGPRLWLVGGALRDHFLQRQHPDRDFAVQGEARVLARQTADRLGGRYFTLDAERDAGRVLWQGHGSLDFVRLRGDTIEQDLTERDFTINALATPIGEQPELIDPLGGLQHLRDRRLVTCSPRALEHDPVRTLRGVRLAHQHGLHIPRETAQRVRAAAPGLAEASPERARDELVQMLDPWMVAALRLAHELGCLAPVLPEVGADSSRANSALDHASRLANLLTAFDPAQRGENLATAQIGLALGRYRAELRSYLDRRLPGGRSVRQILFLAALHWPVPEHAAAAQRRARALRFSRREAQWAHSIVEHADPGRTLAIDGAVERYRFLEAAGEAAVAAVLLALAIELAKRAGPPDYAAWEQHTLAAGRLVEAGLNYVPPQPLVDGERLMGALGLPPGPQIGDLLERIQEAQVEGTIASADQAIELARSLLERDELDG